MARSAAVISLALLVVAAGGCGGSKKVPDSKAAAQAITSFTKAFSTGDGAKACDLLTPAARAAFLKRTHELAPTTECSAAMKKVHDLAGESVTQPFGSATVSDVKVTGATATARLTASGHATAVYLSKQDGDWKLNGVPGI
jgi:hypothetical protein